EHCIKYPYCNGVAAGVVYQVGKKDVAPLVIVGSFELRRHDSRQADERSIEVNFVCIINKTEIEVVGLVLVKARAIEPGAIPCKAVIAIKSFVFPCRRYCYRFPV